jgi:hypothetical protein
MKLGRKQKRMAKQRAAAMAVHGVIESLESRVLLNAGGGYQGAGITGSYYDNATLSGTPAFTRVDDRIDFNFGSTGTPGGSTDPQYAIGTTNWSSEWSGQIVPKYSETYTFTMTSEGAAQLYLAPSGQALGSPQINDFNEHTTQAVDTFSMSLTAGKSYNIELIYETTSSPSQIQLQWSSPSTPIEDIEPAAAVGINVDGGDGLLANLVNAGTRDYWWAAGNTNATIPTDSNFWPTTDGEIFLGEGDQTIDSGGTYLIQFKGTATVTPNLISGSFYVNGVNYGGTLPDGVGYNPATGLTTASLVITPETYYNGIILEFTNTSREGNTTNPQQDGITNLYVMQPTTLGGNVDPAPGTLFTQSALTQLSQYSTLRVMGLTDTNDSIVSDWADRTIPSDEVWTGWELDGGANAVSTGVSGTYGTGIPWEVIVALANETGKDIYIDVPSNASQAYINDLADLFAYGSNGVLPYTSPQANPVWAPLNSNLKIYIEFSNELFNAGFTQAGTSGDGWANQLSQRAIYDYLTDNQNDPLYPGGGANGYNDGSYLAPLYINSSNQAAWLATYTASPPPSQYGESPAYFSNADSNMNGYEMFQGWVALRLEQISTAFKTVFGELSVDADSNNSRVRPVYEWEYGGEFDGALNAMQTMFGATNRVGYYLYGGGAGWYADDTDSGFSDTTFANGNFATTPAISGSPGYVQDPTGTSWTYTGAAGIAANGSTLGNPYDPNIGPPNNPTGTGQTAYLQPGASISESVDFSGGWADITLLATQTLGANSYNGEYGMTVSVDGAPITQAEGGNFYSGNQDDWTWDRTVAFYVTPGYHTVTFTSQWTAAAAQAAGGAAGVTVFVDNVGIQTVNGMFSDTAAGGTPSISTVLSDVKVCQQYGLYDVGYEGGFDFNQNLDGSNDINGYAELGQRGYSGNDPNVGEEANLDPRTAALAQATIDQFYQDGGTLPVEFESYNSPNSWAIAAPTYFNTSTPKQQAVDTVEQSPPPATTFASVTVPGTLTPSSLNQDYNDSAGSMQAGGWIDWNIDVPVTETYTFTATTTAGGTYRMSISDITTLSTGTSGQTIDPTMTLYPGIYTVKMEDLSGAFAVSQIQITEAGSPSVSPTLNTAVDGSQSAALSWTGVAGATAYEIGYGTTSGDYTSFVSAGAATSYTVTGLTNNTTYYFAIYAVNASGLSIPSNEKFVTPLGDNDVGTLASWNFAGVSDQANNVASTGGTSRVTASPLSQGPGLITTFYTYTGSFGYYPNGSNYANTLSGALAAGQYVQFTLTPATGRTLSLQSLTFDPYFQQIYGSGAGISYSTNGGSTFSAGIAATGSPEYYGTPYTVNLSNQSALQNTPGPVIIRIALYGDEIAGFSGIGDASGNNLVVTGSFSPLGSTASYQLAIAHQPNATATAGQSTGSLVVDVEDQYGNLVTTDNSTVTLSSNATLIGTTSTTAVNGVATFTGLAIDQTGNYTITASDTGLLSATTSAVNILPAPATHLVFAQQATNAVAGQSIGTVAIDVEDQYGNIATGNNSMVTLAATSLTGTTSVAAVNGVATFTGLSMTKAGTFALSATDPGLASTTSNSITISAASSSKLAFTQQPASAAAGASLGTVAVSVEDAYGNLVTTDHSTVSLAGNTLTGTLAAAAVNGVATFTGLSMTQSGTFALSATDGTLTPGASSSITISPAQASKLIIAQQPNSATAGQSIGTVIVEIEDQYGNIVTGNTSTVTLAGTSLTGKTSVTAVNGVAVFTGLSMTQAGKQTLTATSGTLTSATSNSITISPAAANKLVFTLQPSSAVAGSSLGTVAVTVEDTYGNVVTSNSSTVTLTGTTLTGTTSVAAVNGVATFTNLSMTQIGSATLSATDGSLTPATSATFTITAPPTPTPMGEFDFYGDTGVETADAAAYQAANVVVSSISRGSGLSPNNQGFPGAFGNSICSIPVGNIYSTTAAQAMAANQYYQFTISPAAGQNLSLSSLGFSAWCQNPQSTFAASLAYSINGTTFTTVPLTGSLATATWNAPASVSATLSTIAALQNTAQTVTFRICLIGGGGDEVSGLGRTSSDNDLFVNGTTAAGSHLVILQQPASASVAGQSIGTVQVAIENASGTILTSNTSTITLAGAGLTGTTSVAAVGGVATFTGLSITKAGAQTLAITDSGLSATTNSITISPAAASQLVFTAQPTNAVTGASIGTVTVAIEDAYGNVVTTNTTTITLATTSPITGITSVAAVNGVATFTGLSMSQTGSYTLSATDGTLTAATSAAFTVTTPVITAPLGQFNFTGDTGVETADAPVYQATGATVSSVSRGTGLSPNNQGFPGAFGNSICSIPVGNNYSTTLAAAQTANQYYQFTVSAAQGQLLSLSSIGFSAWCQNPQSTFAAALTYSTNGTTFTSVPLTGSLSNATWNAPASVSANLASIAALQSTTATVTFRIYLIGGGADEVSGLGRSNSNNDLFVNGGTVA